MLLTTRYQLFGFKLYSKIVNYSNHTMKSHFFHTFYLLIFNSLCHVVISGKFKKKVLVQFDTMAEGATNILKIWSRESWKDFSTKIRENIVNPFHCSNFFHFSRYFGCKLIPYYVVFGFKILGTFVNCEKIIKFVESVKKMSLKCQDISHKQGVMMIKLCLSVNF